MWRRGVSVSWTPYFLINKDNLLKARENFLDSFLKDNGLGEKLTKLETKKQKELMDIGVKIEKLPILKKIEKEELKEKRIAELEEKYRKKADNLDERKRHIEFIEKMYSESWYGDEVNIKGTNYYFKFTEFTSEANALVWFLDEHEIEYYILGG